MPDTVRIDIAVIGAGVVGLAAAQRLAGSGKTLAVLEKNGEPGQEVSSRNSEVIHAGLYYPQGFLKSRLCVAGNQLLYAWCEAHRVPHRRIGKLVVAVNAVEEAQLAGILAQAAGNGVEGLTLLGRHQVQTLEPAVAACAALYSPNTGILDTHALMRSLRADAEAKGVHVVCRAEVSAIGREIDGYVLEVNDGEYRILAHQVVNAAGLGSDRIAALAGIDIDAAGYRLKPCKGNYFAAAPAPKLNHLVYPVPAHNNVSLGIHATLDLSGRVRFGPDSRYLPTPPEAIPPKPIFDYAVDEDRKATFAAAIAAYLPGFSADALAPDMSGVRPKIQGPGDPTLDFVLAEETDRGLPGFVNCIGIESPGLTSCLALGDYVKDLLLDH